jgi:hypothetical protein
MAESRVCEAPKVDGEPCQAAARPGSRFCIFHDPECQQQRDEARSKGGKERMRRVAVLPEDAADLPLETVADVTRALAVTFNQVRRGQLDAKVGNCLGVLAGVLLRAFEGSDLAEELAALRCRLEEVEARGTGTDAPGGDAAAGAVGAEGRCGEAPVDGVAGGPGADPFDGGDAG